nr:NADH dehydrogenase subunit 4 [Trichophilopterus babakotophilus]
MLTFFSSFFFLKIKKPEVILFSLIFIMIQLLFNYPGFTNIYMNSFFFFDKINYMMLFVFLILKVILYVIYMNKFTNIYNSNMKIMSILSLSIFLFLMIDNIFFLFFFFEMSLIPIFFIVVGWGMQPEKIKSGKFLAMYTVLVSFPLLLSILYLTTNYNLSVFMNYYDISKKMEVSNLMFVLLMSGFLVKLPMFLIHSWLTKAHVEASLEGSILLAGLLMKMGSYGIIRMMIFFKNLNKQEIVTVFFSIFLVGSILSAIMAISCDDAKTVVAFASISHMNFVMANFFLFKTYSYEATILIMFSHSFVSTLLFYNVTNLYMMSGTRSSMINKSLKSLFPLFSMICFISWILNASIPPSLSFSGEVLSIMTLFSSNSFLVVVLVFFFFIFSSFYSMVNFGIQNHNSSSKMYMKSKNIDMNMFFVSFLNIIPVSI